MQPEKNKSISTHRAFVYSACAPGWGEIYAGERVRGFLTAACFIFFGGWFSWTAVKIAMDMVGRLFERLNGLEPITPQGLPFLSLGISFFGIYIIWLWAQISSVDAAIKNQHKDGEPLQANVAWAVAISWFCPGAGQVYTDSRRLGYILFSGYIIGILLIVPAYMQLFQSVSELAKGRELSPANPYELIDIIHGLITKVDYSIGKLFQTTVKNFALAGTLAALRQGPLIRQSPLKRDAGWSSPSVGRAAALFGIGWLCPGAGQILQQRDRFGWYLLAGYIGSRVLIGVLLTHSFITVQKADTLAWASVIIQWGAMVEAPLWMLKAKSGNRPSGPDTTLKRNSPFPGK